MNFRFHIIYYTLFCIIFSLQYQRNPGTEEVQVEIDTPEEKEIILVTMIYQK